MSKKYRIRVEFGVYVTALQLVIQVPVLPVSVESRGFNPIFNRPVFGGGASIRLLYHTYIIYRTLRNDATLNPKPSTLNPKP